MITQIDGACYIELMHSGIKSLEKYRKKLNDLNVFPVPDGDTGTNMVMTLRHGYEAIKGRQGTISELSQRFSSAAVFGARGNSGVIVSQFFKGVSEALKNIGVADSNAFAVSIQSGCKFAYASVAQPVEGTILTVLKDASHALTDALPLGTINEAVDIFLKEARVSLSHTPDLLPILKKASVVDSGGSGIVYFFDGIQKFLNGEPIEDDADADEEDEDEHTVVNVDLSLFSKNTSFDYGYCVEGLIQLKLDTNDFNHANFKRGLGDLGESIVSSLEGDKVKIHIHVKTLARLMEYCQRIGEFLTIKIENMTVQNIQKEAEQNNVQKFLYDPEREKAEYAIVAVATNPYMQRKFFDMGADVVILSDIAPSSQDFMEAFKLSGQKNVLVFPNSANSILASMQAGSLYRDARIAVLNSRSAAECYSVLAVMDFETSIDEAVSFANDVLAGIYQLSIYHAVKDVRYGNERIDKDDFFALSSNKLLDVCTTLDDTVLRSVDKTLKEREINVVTIFYGKNVTDECMRALPKRLRTSATMQRWYLFPLWKLFMI